MSPCTAIFVCIFFQAGWAGRGRLIVILSIEKSRRNVENPRKKSAKMRYKLRSSTKSDSNETQADRSSTREAKDSLCHSPVASTSKNDSSGGPPEKKARICCRRKVVHKASLQSIKSENPDGIKDIKVEHSKELIATAVQKVLNGCAVLKVAEIMNVSYGSLTRWVNMAKQQNTCCKDNFFFIHLKV